MSRGLSGTKRLRYAHYRLPTPLGIAAQLGWIEAAFDHDRIAVRALHSGADPKSSRSDVDPWLANSFRQGGSIPAIWSRAGGRDTRLLGLTWTDESQAILTRADSDIHAVADLKGKRLGVVTCPSDPIDVSKATTIRAYMAALQSQGLSEKDVQFVDLPTAEVSLAGRLSLQEDLASCKEARALQGGDVDVVFCKGPRGLDLAEVTGARTVYDLGGHPDPKVRINNGSLRTLTASAFLVENDFPLVVRLVKKIVQAGWWAETHREETLRKLAEETRSSESAIVRAYGSDVHRHLRTDLAPTSVAALGDFVGFLAEWRLIPGSFDVHTWIDARPLDQALAELAEERELSDSMSTSLRLPV
jgi:ABC-type nitrate/sulfonate/bicarbonate transport system substrate-binding protein